MNIDTLKSIFEGFNWVDSIVLVWLILGAVAGRRRGMSRELLDLIQWVLIVNLGAWLCVPFGVFVDRLAHFGPLWSRIASYLFVMLVVVLLFSFLQRMVGEKLTGSDVFGGMEYYLGIVAGMLRAACLVIVVFSMLHARAMTPAEAAAQAKALRENFGGIGLPTLSGLQTDIFKNSVSGRRLEMHMDRLLIPPSYAGGAAAPAQ